MSEHKHNPELFRKIILEDKQVVLVDEDIADKIKGRKLTIGEDGYVRLFFPKPFKKTWLLHRLILHLKLGKVVKWLPSTHRDGNKLNNTLANLGFVSEFGTYLIEPPPLDMDSVETTLNFNKIYSYVKRNDMLAQDNPKVKKLFLYNTTYTLVNREYYAALRQFNWSMNYQGYVTRAARLPTNTSISLHRIIAHFHYGGLPEGYQVDHIDRNPLNNTTANLRLVTPYINMMNREIKSKCKLIGVGFLEKQNKWKSFIQRNHILYNLGKFDTAEEAGRARDKKALELYGTSVRLNFPEEEQNDLSSGTLK